MRKLFPTVSGLIIALLFTGALAQPAPAAPIIISVSAIQGGASGGGGASATSWIGVPDPGFCLDDVSPTPPSSWSSEVAGYYYVDRDESGNTDTGRTYGYPGAARATVPASLSAGSVVFLNGEYDNARLGGSRLVWDGSEESPIWLIGYDSESPPRITRNWEMTDSNYWFVEHVMFADDLADATDDAANTGRFDFYGVLAGPITHGCIRHSEISGNVNEGGSGLGDGLAEYIVYYNNYIHHNGDWEATFDQDNHGIGVGGGGDKNHIWILDNEFAYNSGDGVQVNGDTSCLNGTAGTAGATTCSTNHIYMAGNYSHHNKQSGLWVKQASDVIISQNRFENLRFSDSAPGACAGYQYGPTRVWFLANECSNSDEGIVAQSASDLGFEGGTNYWIGNRIYNIHRTSSTTAYGAIRWREGDSAINVVMHNTIHDVDRGIYTHSVTNGEVHLYNNLISAVVNSSGTPTNRVIQVDNSTVAGNSTFHNNQFAGTWDAGIGGSTITTTGTFNNGTNRTGNIAAAHGMIDPSTGDLHLDTGASGIDAGFDSSDVFDTFLSLYGLDISEDFEADTIPTGSAPDIGADEVAP